MPVDNELHRELGNHDAKIEVLERELREVRDDQRRIFEKLEQISLTLSEAKGGWRTLMWVGGAGATLVLALEHSISWVISLPWHK